MRSTSTTIIDTSYSRKLVRQSDVAIKKPVTQQRLVVAATRRRIVRMEEDRKEKEGEGAEDFSWDLYKPEHAAVLVDNEVIKRNKRCLLAYM